jgi:hypothetical protein
LLLVSASRGCGEVEQIGARARKQEGEREEEEDRRKDRFRNVIKCVLFRVVFLDTSLGYLSSFSPGLSITLDTSLEGPLSHTGYKPTQAHSVSCSLPLLCWTSLDGLPRQDHLDVGR